jgi:FolB domain-containing protein
MSEDQIQIKDLLLRGILGINDEEREKRQDILTNITLFGDFRKAGSSDRIEDCINYRTVTKKVIDQVEGGERFTVEALAADIARICLQEPGVAKARVRVEKPGALRFARSVGVEIERRAEDFT